MWEWPRFADYLDGVRSPEERVGLLLADLAERTPTPSAGQVLAACFADGTLVDALERLAPRVHHVGLIAPADLRVASIADVLKGSPFRSELRKFKSAVLAKDFSSRFGRGVDVMVVQGNDAAPSARYPSVEIFVADLQPKEIEDLVVHETGCHVALALGPDTSLDQVLGLLHAHGCWEIPLMRDGPLANHEIHSSVLYVDTPLNGRVRRLEFIAPESPTA